ncbi:MAG: hypothetical protein R3E31_19315 [Chloroflexota bacterium]
MTTCTVPLHAFSTTSPPQLITPGLVVAYDRGPAQGALFFVSYRLAPGPAAAGVARRPHLSQEKS